MPIPRTIPLVRTSLTGRDTVHESTSARIGLAAVSRELKASTSNSLPTHGMLGAGTATDMARGSMSGADQWMG